VQLGGVLGGFHSEGRRLVWAWSNLEKGGGAWKVGRDWTTITIDILGLNT
jgi:hypothetical protein